MKKKECKHLNLYFLTKYDPINIYSVRTFCSKCNRELELDSRGNVLKALEPDICTCFCHERLKLGSGCFACYRKHVDREVIAPTYNGNL